MACVRRDFTVKTVDGVQIGIRSVQLKSPPDEPAVPMILMHGTRIPGISEFDLPVAGGSLAEDLARAGHVCYIPDARGFGASARPDAMNEPPRPTKPIVRSLEITRDVDAAVNALRAETGADRVGLFGWGTGGTVVLIYAALWPENVSHIILYNPLYGGAPDHPEIGRGSRWEDPERPARFNQKKYGNYYFNQVDMLRKGWDNQIPIEDKDAWRDPAVLAAFEQALLNGDPTSLDRDPPTYRSPNGMLEDSFYMGLGHKLVHANQVYCRVMVISPQYDTWTRREDLAALKDDLIHAEEVRIWEPANTTHYILLDRPERGRDEALRRMEDFLSQGKSGLD
ncbi:alpha/beta hydrolase [Chelatococcus asaccharovorans]|uniref:Alpha-beta hydrolase superfamily lysophospholipase n=1 Tax=Chelatococcus asaccharovorans TaxID=28210 RepID=A0A2V3UEF4_9HYPH|nr:alpha/beta fold hydrolase [Chelatococcus asaccharovorans]MBS7707248.1 alpha/beta fold hydrolase [Chelatococcus asaccharovorans]PXW63430.1 alpha-beta hydrolase superfamily lysophospholipase [Chelatococcus asaccharovorans]